MKKCIIIVNLLFYIIFLNQWNLSESHPTSSSSGTTDTDTKESKDTVTLDINKNKDTNEFNYIKNGDFRTYTPKDSYAFNKVVKKNLDIWTSKPNDHGLKVVLKGSGKDEKHLGILLKSHNFVLLRKTGKNQPWQDLTSKRYDITNLKFFGESDKELKSSDYTVTIVDLSYTYIFNDGIKCKKIKLGDDEVWNHTDDNNFADIKSISLDLVSNSFFVRNQSDESKKIEKEFKELTKPSEATKVTLDIDKKESTDEFEYTGENGIITYKPKDDHVFNKVSKGTTSIWESKDDVCGTLVRIMTNKAFRSKTDVSFIIAILISNGLFKLFIQTAGKWKDLTSERHDISKLKFLGENDTELSTSDYKIDLFKLSYTYEFNDGIKCKKIKLGDDEVWKHDDDSNFAEIKSISLDLLMNKFILKNQSDETKELDFKPTTTPTSTSETTPSGGTTPATQSQSTGSKSQSQSGTPPTSSPSGGNTPASQSQSGTQSSKASGGSPASQSQ